MFFLLLSPMYTMLYSRENRYSIFSVSLEAQNSSKGRPMGGMINCGIRLPTITIRY